MSGIKIVEEPMDVKLDLNHLSQISGGTEISIKELNKIDLILRPNPFPSMENFTFTEKMRLMNYGIDFIPDAGNVD